MRSRLPALGSWRILVAHSPNGSGFLKDNGLLLLILPHNYGTVDWRCPPIPSLIMIEAIENGIGEAYLTHLPEILDLRDLSNDETAGTKEQFRKRCHANHLNRTIHRHFSDTMIASADGASMSFSVVRVDKLAPHHVIIFAVRNESN